MLKIGKIVKPQGLKGEMKVLPYGEIFLFDAKSISIDNICYDLLQYSNRQNGLFIKLKGIDTIEKVRHLINKEIEIDLDIARQLIGEDRFLWQDIIGRNIIIDNKVVGRVLDIDNYGSADIIFAIDNNDNKFSFPLVKNLIINFDPDLELNAQKFNEVVCYESWCLYFISRDV